MPTISTSSKFIIYSGKMRCRGNSLGREISQILGNRRNRFSLNAHIVGKTAVLHLAHFCS
jgi:hypothetical protein